VVPIFLSIAAITQAAELRAIQRGTTTMAASGGKVYVTLGSVLRDTTKAFLVFSSTETGSTAPGTFNVAGQILGDDSLVFTRSDAGSSNLNSISWEVYEFTSGVFVQRGAVANSSASTNITLPTAVDLARSFPIVTHFRAGTVFGGDDALAATLNSTTNLKLDFGATANDSAYWQVIQYDDCSVQQISTTLAAASTSTTSTIPMAVTTSKTMVLSSYKTNIDINAYDVPRTELTNSTTLTFTRAGSSGTINLQTYVVQFNDSTTVTRATSSFASGTGTNDITLSPAVDTSLTGIIVPGLFNRAGSTNNTTGAFGYNYFTLQLTSNTNLRIIRGDATGQTSDMPYQLVAFSKNEHTVRNYSTNIYFNTTSTGANVSSDQTNFPMLVRLNANNFLFSQADPNGADIRFGDPDGSPLKYQIERWDAANALAEIWVQVPTVSGNSTQDYITMYWGNNSAMSASNGPAVFPTGAGFVGVWHLNADLNDATANANNLADNSGTVADTGLISGSRSFNASNLKISNTTTLNMTSAITISAWIRPVDWTGGDRRILQKGSSDNQYRLLKDNAGLKFDLTGVTGGTLTYATLPSTGDWHLVTGAYDGSTIKIYVDGVAVASQAASGSIATTTSNIDVGGKPGSGLAGDRFYGNLDDVVLASQAWSADWVKLAYETQKRNSTVLTFPNTALSTWSYSNKIYVNTTATGANITGNQAGYPLLVRLTGANFNFSQARSDGADLRFADSSGALLSYEIERFDAVGKLAEIWVRIPVVYGNNNAQWFRMYWGKSVATSLSSGSDVFPASNGFVGVWHLNEKGNTAAGGYANASSRINTGTGTGGLTSGSEVAGQMGLATNFVGASNQGVNIAHDASQHSNTALTLQVWTNSASQGANKRMLCKSYTSAATPWVEYDIESSGAGNTFLFSAAIGGTGYSATATTAMSNGAWYMATGTFDGSKLRVYTNGSLEATTTQVGSINNYAGTLTIGKYPLDNNSNFNGKIDEVRISNVVRSADWIKLDYETMKTGSTVVTVGARTPDYAKSVRLHFNTTATGANVSGNVANIPILVRFASANLDFSVTQNDGRDIQFVDKDGTFLYHEIVEWDKANTTGKAWVKVPQVDGNSTTDYITLYYGCSTCSGTPYALRDSVWSGYNGVWHLPGGNTARDATRYGNTLSYATNLPSAAGITTALANRFDGTNDYAKVTPAGSELDFGTGDFSIGAWVKTTLTPASGYWPMIVSKESATGTRNGYNLLFNQNSGAAAFEVWSNTTSALKQSASSSLNDGNWHYLVGKKTSSAVELYVDGVSSGTTSHTLGSTTTASDFGVGKRLAGSGYNFNGYISEAQVAPSAFSADYIKLSYENQKANSTLFSTTTITTASFQKSKVFKLNTTASGANIAGDVYNFPLLLRIKDANGGIIDQVQSTGADIRFVDNDGVTFLPYQIERWDQSTDSAEVWVLVPRVYGNSNTQTLTLYYQQASGVTVPDGQCGACVFSPSNGFAGVWHLNETGNNTAGGYMDATGNGNAGTGTGMVAGTKVSALAAQGQNFDGSTQYISAGTSAGSGASQTVSFWLKANSLGNYTFLDKNPNDASGVGWTFKTRGTAEIWYRLGSESAPTDLKAASAFSAGNWAYVTGTFSPTTSTALLYINGAQSVSNTSVPRSTANGTTTLRFATPSAASTTEKLPGVLDEIQISSVVRDSNWVKLAYQNQRRDATPLFNPSPADFQKTKKYTFNTTKTGANVMGNVTNFPLLVRISGGSVTTNVQGSGTSIPPDIRFLDGDGKTWLNYQVERWDRGVDSAEVWVSVPQVDGNSDHDFITLYYQQASGVTVADGQCASCVFGDYKAVYHLGESPGGGAPQFTDASGNGNHGTAQGGASGDQVSANNGKGFQLNGSSKYVTTTTQYTNPTTFTNGVWFKTTTSSGGLLLGWDNSQTTYASGSHDRMIWMDNTGKLNFGNRNGVQQTVSGSTAYNDGSWHYAVMRLSPAGSYIFVDGSPVASNDSYVNAENSSGYWRAGNGQCDWAPASTSPSLNGTLDEVTIAHTEFSADYIKLSYETQRRTGNAFWNSRSGPNNQATLTATANVGSISLSWTTPVSDSSNADSVGLWVKYNGYPDSVGAVSTTRVITLPKTDSAYTYPATYPGTYYFALAVRNANGAWSPFTRSSSSMALLAGVTTFTDTVYVDSAIGSNAYTCLQARNPATPKLTFMGAAACESDGIHDTLFIRALPGNYASDHSFDSNVKPIVFASFDRNSRAVLNGSGTGTADGGTRAWTAFLYNDVTLLYLDIKCATNGASGIYVSGSDDRQRIEGCRIYNNGSLVHGYGIELRGNGNYRHIANTLIHQPSSHGIYTLNDNSFNIVNNVLIGTGAVGTRGIYMNRTAFTNDMTITNNILYNWDYGIQTTSANIGVCSNNLFHLVTSGREVTGVSDANKVLRDPLFANMTIGSPNAFKLLPGSPAIDAGTSSYASGAEAVPYRSSTDLFGNPRPIGTAPDIGLYEGTGYTSTPASEFDTLTTVATATTVTVKSSKWKLVWDKARGGGINFFSDVTVDSTINLLASNSLLFDAKIDAYQVSSQTSNSIAPAFTERTRTRAVVRQRLAVSASLDLNIYYAVYASGHIYVTSELSNLANTTTTVGTVDYTLKLGTVAAAFTSAGTKNGFGYLLTASRDAMLGVTQDLDGNGAYGETWATSTATSGSPGTLVFNTADLADLGKNTRRLHHFLLYVGDKNLDFQKSATLSGEAYTPSRLTTSAGSLLLERDWQNYLTGHWTLDDGAGATARDKAVYFQNNAAITGPNYKWVSGKVGGGLYLTASDTAKVTTNVALDASPGGTYMFWIKPDWSNCGSTAYIVSKGTSTSNGWFFRRSGNAISFNMGAASVTGTALTTAVWSHVAVVAVASSTGNKNLDMYVNGVLVASSTASATMAANASDLLFGYALGGTAADKFQGTLDDIRVFKNDLGSGDIQAVYNQGFSQRMGHYALRADNNNRVVALINGGAAATRTQPAFQIANWYGPKTPKYVYLNGVRLMPNTDFVVDSVGNALYGAYLVLQLNKILRDSDQTLFVDDDDSTGYMGDASRMKTLSITATASDKIAIKNFQDTVFGSATSRQWYMELDLKGWSTPTVTTGSTKGFGEINVWKSAATRPNVGISSANNLVGYDGTNGLPTSLSPWYYDLTASTNTIFSGTKGFANPAAFTYTIVDSSATRLSIVLSNASMSGDGTFTLIKRWTFYPTGRVVGSYRMTNISAGFNVDDPRLNIQLRASPSMSDAWTATRVNAKGRVALIGGNLDAHSLVAGMLSVKNNTNNYPTAAGYMNGGSTIAVSDGSSDSRRTAMKLLPSLFTQANGTNTANFFLDFSKDFADSASADSVAEDLQNPAVLTAITGTRTTNDTLDFNSDNFAEGDGAYTYAASNGIAHFRFANTVTSFNPAFRINTWTYGTVPEFVMLDNQILTRGYHYNVYLNTAGIGGGELVMQFSKTLAPGTHVFYISHKTGLAVTLRTFEAKSGEGVDTLEWTTESEFENLGYHVYRRVAQDDAQIDSSLADGEQRAGIANALRAAAAGGELAKKAEAKLDSASADSLPSVNLTEAELAALGYVRITAKLIPGAKGGSSASTQDYRFIDRTAAFGTTYEYLLESVDFHNNRAQYGPRVARPSNPLTTELYANYPNPFNPITTLRFSLKDKIKVSLIIYDSRGRIVRTLIRPDKPMNAGKYRLIWDAKNEAGMEVPSGQYFYRFTAGRYVKARKMILVK
jgi:hypothetical protein